MRTIKKLLEIMLTKTCYFEQGLCGWATTLYSKGIFDHDELIIMKGFIAHNRPSMYSSWSAFWHCNSSFYWKPGDIKPRIKWIKEHIEKFKKEEK